MARALRVATLAMLATAPACHRGGATPADAGGDVARSDGPSQLTLAIAITGCRTYAVDSSGGHCRGPAPLDLALSTVGSPDFLRFTWSFGDGTPDVQDRAPTHGYAFPGTYAVVLTGVLGQGGTVQTNASIVVEPVAVGAPCDVDAQCATDLTCVCANGAGCPPAFTRGLCSTPCANAACPTGGVCTALSLGAIGTDGGPATAASCLASCDAGCPAGLVCETLAGVGSSAGKWVRGCVPLGALADVGAPCRNALGALDDELCATELCADLGALGACSASCDLGQTCPEGTACATLADGRRLCLLQCTVAGACQRDPLLACVAADSGTDGSAGNLQVDAAAGATFCGPKPCAGDADCLPAGHCGPNGSCVKN